VLGTTEMEVQFEIMKDYKNLQTILAVPAFNLRPALCVVFFTFLHAKAKVLRGPTQLVL